MKFKEMPPRKNLLFMCFLVPVFIFIIVCMFILKNYIYAYCYLVICLVLAYFYLFTYYYLNEDNLMIKVGLFKIKIFYKDITDVVEEENKLTVKTKKLKFYLYPSNSKAFKNKFKEKLDVNVNYIVVNGGK